MMLTIKKKSRTQNYIEFYPFLKNYIETEINNNIISK